MDKKLIRVWTDVDIDEVYEHLLIIGDLLASCAKCSNLDLKPDAQSCPKCGATFKYFSFRNPEENIPKMLKMKAQNKDLIFIDYADFKKMTGALKARKFFK